MSIKVIDLIKERKRILEDLAEIDQQILDSKTEIGYAHIPIRSKKEGLLLAEDFFGAICWIETKNTALAYPYGEKYPVMIECELDQHKIKEQETVLKSSKRKLKFPMRRYLKRRT